MVRDATPATFASHASAHLPMPLGNIYAEQYLRRRTLQGDLKP